MLNSVKGMMLTLASTFQGLKKPVTREYPKQPTPVQPRFMGFPALTWDNDVDEPFCTGCMVCIRNCPTQCMSASMMDNPLNEEGKSHRRKIVDYFEINLNRCILCGICVELCNFDAIVMSHEHEMSTYERNGDRVDLPALLDIGKKYQRETAWIPPTVLAKAKKEAEDAAKAAAAESEEPAAAAQEGD
ncbi:MAG: NADH-quinone oxidoreductase subunit I [Chloroflexota bacterium]|nr:NADH-quinone oxidoreductase subunit I [Chloroflexota bacterium]